jgi:hypothetical protein
MTMNRFLRGTKHALRELPGAIASRFGCARGLAPAPRTERALVVSLTTIPERLHRVHLVIERLLRQSWKPHRLVLWLSPSRNPERLTFPLRQQMRRGLEVRFVPDLGPHTKVIYALRSFPDWLVVTADDDTLYPTDWLGELVTAHRRHPDCVICHRAHGMTFDERQQLLPYARWDWLARGNAGPSRLLFPTGVGGVLYPPGSLHPEVHNEQVFRRLCPTADDIWLKAMSLLTGARCQKVKPSYSELPQVSGTQHISLSQTNALGGKNDPQLRAVFDHYGLFARLARWHANEAAEALVRRTEAGIGISWPVPQSDPVQSITRDPLCPVSV